jgi:hypothetical protein
MKTSSTLHTPSCRPALAPLVLPDPAGYRGGTLRLYFPITGEHQMDRPAGKRALEA